MQLNRIACIAALVLMISACGVDSPDQPFIDDAQLSAVDITTNALTLRWNPATIRSSGPISYKAYYSPANNLYSVIATEQFGIAVNPPLTATTCRITGLETGKLYYFNVIADGNGYKILHKPFAVYTADTNAPAAGSYISTRMPLNNSIKVVWSKGNDAITPSDKLSYRVYYSTSNNITNVASILANGTAGSDWLLNTTNHTVTGLTPSSAYYFSVLVKDEWGNIGFSDSTGRYTPDSNNNFILNGNFSGGEANWSKGWNPSTAGAIFISGRSYFYSDNGGTGFAQAYVYQGKYWREGDPVYAQFTVAPSIPSTVIGFAYLKVEFRDSSGVVATYQNEMHTGNQHSGTMWIKTDPAPTGTINVRIQIGIYKSSGSGQMRVYGDNVSFSVLTNQ